MASVFDVAKYVLKKLGSITTMKLEKEVYYCQAWANGPVCPELFQKHKGQFVVNEDLFKDLPDYQFEKDEIETMDAVLDYYGDKEPQWLSELTHKELPWKEARAGIALGEPCSNVISKESMQQYYGGL